MLKKYEKGDVLTVPVGEGNVAVAQIVENLGGNVLLAVYPELFGAGDDVDVPALGLDEPIFLVETMDLRITEGVWRVIGNSEVPPAVPVPGYKVWVEPPGEYRRQDIHGTVGEPISRELAETLKLQKSYSPAVVETALRGYHGLGPWRPAFDDLTI